MSCSCPLPQAVQTLLNLQGNGNPVSIPEDEKLWIMIESNFKTLEFEYCPTFEQSLERVTWRATQIKRYWTAHRHRSAVRLTVLDGVS